MMLVKYTNTLLKINPNLTNGLWLDADFAIEFSGLLTLAHTHGITFFANSGFRKDTNVPGAIVTPAKMSNHLIGYAVDVNMIYNGVFHNSEMLKNLEKDKPDFVHEAIELGFRWGGHFKKIDTVHFDIPVNINNPDLWNKLYKEYHS